MFLLCCFPAKCQFAHGLGELRHVVRHPKYKTTKCKSYWGSGHCPYGSRCRFIHEEVEGYSTPQYSPQGPGMGSMFLSDHKDHLAGVGVGLGGGLGGPSDLGPLPSPVGGGHVGNNYLYGADPQSSHQQHHMGASAMSSYPKDNYSLLSSFDKSAWGPAGAVPGGVSSSRTSTQSKLTYAGDHHVHGHHHHHTISSHHQLQQHQHHPFAGPIGGMPLSSPTHHHNNSISGASATSSSNQSGYPDLQDAIDALMKFSLTQDDEESASEDGIPAATASSVSVPVESTSAAGSLGVSGSASAPSSNTNADPLAPSSSDELWKDFPASVSSSVEKLDTTSWSSGLVLNLDNNKPFDVNEKKSGSGSEHSPRLSVFERFH